MFYLSDIICKYKKKYLWTLSLFGKYRNKLLSKINSDFKFLWINVLILVNSKILFEKIKNKQSGQILLLIVLILSTLSTLVSAITLRVANDIQITTAQEEGSTIEFIAESAVEQAISKFNTDPTYIGEKSYDSLYASITPSPDPTIVNTTNSKVSIYKKSYCSRIFFLKHLS